MSHFRKQFRINGPDENAIRAFLTVERRKLLMERPNERLQTHTIRSSSFAQAIEANRPNSLHQLMEDGLIVAKLLGATHHTNENSSPEMDEEFEDSEEADSEEEPRSQIQAASTQLFLKALHNAGMHLTDATLTEIQGSPDLFHGEFFIVIEDDDQSIVAVSPFVTSRMRSPFFEFGGWGLPPSYLPGCRFREHLCSCRFRTTSYSAIPN